MTKIRRNVCIDEDLWELGKLKLGIPLSTFFNNALKEALLYTNDKEELEKEIMIKEAGLMGLKSKYNQLEESEKSNNEYHEKYDVAMETINRIYNTHGVVGENQIFNIANHNNINKDMFLDHVKAQGVNIIKGFEPVRERKMKNGVSLSRF